MNDIKRIAFFIVVATFSLSIILFQLYILFGNKLGSRKFPYTIEALRFTLPANKTFYYSTFSSFQPITAYQIMSIFDQFMRECFKLISLLVLNGLILGLLRQSTKRRIAMDSKKHQASSAAEVKESRQVRTALQNERRKCQMMVVTGVIYFINHIGFLWSL